MCIKNLTVSLLAIALMSGCASMSKSECLSADWLQRGVQDGSSGALASTLTQHDKACAKVGITPDQALYLQGHAQGLISYCTPEKGLLEGRQNNEYLDVCPQKLEANFLASYIDGLELKLIELESNRYHPQSLLDRLRREQAALGNKSDKLLTKRISTEQKTLRRNTAERYQIRARIANYRVKLHSSP